MTQGQLQTSGLMSREREEKVMASTGQDSLVFRLPPTAAPDKVLKIRATCEHIWNLSERAEVLICFC